MSRERYFKGEDRVSGKTFYWKWNGKTMNGPNPFTQTWTS